MTKNKNYPTQNSMPPPPWISNGAPLISTEFLLRPNLMLSSDYNQLKMKTAFISINTQLAVSPFKQESRLKRSETVSYCTSAGSCYIASGRHTCVSNFDSSILPWLVTSEELSKNVIDLWLCFKNHLTEFNTFYISFYNVLSFVDVFKLYL